MFVKDPVRDYLSQPNAPQNRFVIERGIRELTLDVNGSPVTFISAGGYGDGKEGNIWTAYVQTADGFNKIATTSDGGTIVFSAVAFYDGSIPELGVMGLVAYIRGSKDAGDLWLYKLSDGGLSVKTIKTLDLTNDKDAAFAQKYFGFGSSILRSEAEHPVTAMDPDVLLNAGYTLPERNDEVPPRRADYLLPPPLPATNPPPSNISKPPADMAPTESHSVQPTISKANSAQKFPANGTTLFVWICSIVVLSLLIIVAFWYRSRFKQ